MDEANDLWVRPSESEIIPHYVIVDPCYDTSKQGSYITPMSLADYQNQKQLKISLIQQIIMRTILYTRIPVTRSKWIRKNGRKIKTVYMFEKSPSIKQVAQICGCTRWKVEDTWRKFKPVIETSAKKDN